MSDTDTWKRRIGLADSDGTVVELEHYDETAWIGVDGGAFSLRVMNPEPTALRQISAAALDLAERIEEAGE